jgi:hypothetical protein
VLLKFRKGEVLLDTVVGNGGEKAALPHWWEVGEQLVDVVDRTLHWEASIQTTDPSPTITCKSCLIQSLLHWF